MFEIILNEMTIKQLHKERIEEAENRRLLRRSRKPSRAMSNVIAGLGRQMVSLGERLQRQPEPKLQTQTKS